jgi:hypothetical protein
VDTSRVVGGGNATRTQVISVGDPARWRGKTRFRLSKRSARFSSGLVATRTLVVRLHRVLWSSLIAPLEGRVTISYVALADQASRASVGVPSGRRNEILAAAPGRTT